MNWNSSFRGGNEVYGESIYTSRIEIFGKYNFNKDLFFQFSFNDHDQNSVYGNTIFNAKQSISFGQLIWNKKLTSNDFIPVSYTHLTLPTKA